MASPWKNPDTGIYYIRRRIPKELQRIINRGAFWKKSLGTREFSEACERFAVAYTESTEAFKVARAELAGLPIVKPSDGPKLADRWAKEIMSHWEANPDAVNEFLATVYPEGERPHPVPAFDVLDMDSPKTAASIVLPYIQSTLRGLGLPVPDPGDPSWEALRLSFLHRWHDLCRIAYDRFLGDWRTALALTEAEKPLATETKTKEAQRLATAKYPSMRI